VIPPAEWLQLFQSTSGEVMGSLKELRDILKSIDPKDLIQFKKDLAAQARAKKQATKAQAYQAKLDTAQNTINVLSMFVGFGNPKLGREIAVTGSASIQIAKALPDFANLSRTLGRLSP
jgi:phage terminase Nu1 subunit (DNA packaging protein)